MTTQTPTLDIVTITPDMAREWLANNTGNRNVSQVTVDRYARDITAGRWDLTGDTIKVGADGTILDGQHRLLACVASNTPIVTAVVRGIDAGAQKNMDRARTRKVGDVLAMRGVANYRTVAATAKIVWGYEHGYVVHSQTVRPGTPTMTEVLSMIEIPSVEWAAQLAAQRRNTLGVATPPSGIALAAWCARSDKDDFDEFLRTAGESEGLWGRGDPRVTLMDKLRAVQGSKVHAVEAAWFIHRAWTAFAAGEEIKQLKPVQNGRPVTWPHPVEVWMRCTDEVDFEAARRLGLPNLPDPAGPAHP